MVTFRLTYAYWKIIGLCPFGLTDEHEIRVSYGGMVYAMTLVVMYTICYTRAVANRTTFTLSRETPMSIIADFGGLSLEFILITSSWLCFGFRQEQVQKILAFFRKVRKSYRCLGVHEENAKLLTDITVHTIVINFVWYFLCVFDHLLLVNCGDFNLNIWMPFNLPRVVSHNIMVMFTNTMRAIDQRFRLLNERIQALPEEVATKITVRHNSARKDSNNNRSRSFLSSGPLETYGQIHSDLVDLTKTVVEFYSLSILFVMLTHFIQMSSGLYTLCLVCKDRTIWTWQDIGSSLVLCSWFILHFSEMAVLCSVSDSTTKAANQTGNSVHKMLLDIRGEKYIYSAKVLSLRLRQRRVSVDLYGLLPMKLSMIYQVMGMVATYITVMVQLDDQETGGS